MLPDYPETKRLFTRVFQTYMRDKARQISPFGMIETRHMHEGRAMKVTRADESESKSEAVQIGAEMEVTFAEAETLTLEKVIAKYDQVLLDLVRKQTTMVQERLHEDIPESQAVDAKGRPLDAQVLYELLDKKEIEFYPDGRPHEIHVVGPLFAHGRLPAVMQEIDSNPELKKKFDDLMERKKEAWRAREADRELVG